MSGPLPAGVETDWEQLFVSPYSFISAGGIDPGTANDLAFGLHFTLQNPAVPEPASLTLLGSSLLGFAMLRRRKRG